MDCSVLNDVFNIVDLRCRQTITYAVGLHAL